MHHATCLHETLYRLLQLKPKKHSKKVDFEQIETIFNQAIDTTFILHINSLKWFIYMFLKGSSESEDFLIEVSPGTYSITAAMQDTKPQTKTVRINAGESMNLTFNL